MANTNKSNLVLFIFLFLIVLPIVSSAPPFISTNDFGYLVRPPLIDSVKAGQDYEFAVHVFNSTNGMAITQASCSMHLYNSKGDHLVDMVDSTVSHSYDYEFWVNGSNFTEGDYFVNFYCNKSQQGGDTSVQFKVTNSGYLPTTSEAFMYGILLFGLLFITLLVFMAHMGDKALIWKFWWFTITWVLMIGITFILWRLSTEFVSGQVFLANMFHMLWLILMILLFPFMIVLVLWTFFMAIVWLLLIMPYKERGFTTDEAWEQVGSRTKIKWLRDLVKFADLFGGKNDK